MNAYTVNNTSRDQGPLVFLPLTMIKECLLEKFTGQGHVVSCKHKLIGWHKGGD